MVALLLAILDAGGGYLPLDARSPAERMQFILADSGAAILVTDGVSTALAGFDGTVLELCGEALIQRAYQSAPYATVPSDLAYLIYTSGSTGTPKGVMLGHGATHLITWARDAYTAEERSRIAATTSLCFDPSIFEIFVPLCTGGALILKGDALEAFAADERPTMLDAVPSVLAELCRADRIPTSLCILNVGGEALTGDLARAAFRGRPALAIYNHYGPTEATTCATVGRVPRLLLGDPAIGRPARGAKILLLDTVGDPVAEGQTGEIYIGGPGLALGYLNRPDLTAARFIDGPAGRLYRTGDYASWGDGELYFGGRMDQQVKIRGFRIELGEVEAALARVANVDRAVATVREVNGRSQLIGYVQSQHPLQPAAVREALARWLPDYMLPARIIVLCALPLLISGKVDHAGLPWPNKDGAAAVPRDVSRMEQPIIHVFEEILARSAIGPEESFFELGGDSLSSIDAALRLEELLGYELAPALIHQAPTARTLARSLEHGRVREASHISVLQPGGSATPLFCLADLFGQSFNYLSLARRLGADRVVYGIEPGPLQAAFTRDRDISGLTKSFIAELRTIRAHGPYFLAGHSAGGVLAMDLACALERQGEVVRLILLDSYLYSSRPTAGAIAHWALKEARTLVGPRRPVTRRHPSTALFGKLVRQLVAGAPPDWIPRSQLAFAASMMKVGAAYRPGTFRGSTLMIRASERDAIDDLFDQDGGQGWSSALKGDIVQLPVDGGHYTFMREPLVAETAGAVNGFMLARQ